MRERSAAYVTSFRCSLIVSLTSEVENSWQKATSAVNCRSGGGNTVDNESVILSQGAQIGPDRSKKCRLVR